MRFEVLLVVFVIGKNTIVYAQSEPEPLVEQIIESLADKVPEDYDYTELTERLSYYYKHPLNINEATEDDFKELRILNPLQIGSILRHRELNGNYIELMELQSVEALDQTTLKLLLPFITLSKVNTLTNFNLKKLRDGRHDLMIRYGRVLQPQAGYQVPGTSDRSRYSGSPEKVLVRYRYNLQKKLFVSLNMEKDPGEQFFRGNQSAGFDFYSASLFLKDLGKIEKLAVGDYALQFGQGLSLWSGLSFHKGTDVAAAAKQGIGLNPYSSVNEASFFRGIAATIKLNRFYLTPFLSRKPADASFSDQAEITSLGVSGLHRTATENHNKNAVLELVTGIGIQFKSPSLNIGFTGYRAAFDKSFERGKSLYNKFEFTGSQLTNVGANYSYNLKNSYFFGEAAHSIQGGVAFINGVITSLSPHVSSVMLHRYYDRHYHSFYNQALSESTTAVNEKGFYSGLIIKPVPKVEVSTYVDVFKFPWLKFRVDAPSNGYEILSQASYSPSKRMKISARYRVVQKEENDDLDETVNATLPVEKTGYRLELHYKVNDNISVRSRAELSSFKKGNHARQFGQLLFQDFIYSPFSSRISGSMRFAIFDTHDFDTRIYAYENDVLYSYSLPAYQNNGFRFYLNARYKIKRGIDFWVRYAVISYADVTEVGSGLDQISGNRKSDIKLQMRYQF